MDKAIIKRFNSTSNLTHTPDTSPLLTHFRHIQLTGLDNDVMTYVMVSLLLPAGIFSNILIIRVIFRFEKLRTSSGYMLVSLAIADLFVSIHLLLYMLYGSVKEMQSLYCYHLLISMDIFLSSASLIHISMISVERAIAVTWPLYNKKIFTYKFAVKIIIIIWCLCLIQSIVVFSRIALIDKMYTRGIFYGTITTSFIIPITLISISHVSIGFAAARNIHQKKSYVRKSAKNDMEKTIRGLKNREIRVAFNIAFMVLPICTAWSIFFGCTIYEEITHKQFNRVINWLLTYLPFIASSINPFVYLAATETLRNCVNKYLKEILGLYKRNEWKPPQIPLIRRHAVYSDSMFTNRSLLPESSTQGHYAEVGDTTEFSAIYVEMPEQGSK